MLSSHHRDILWRPYNSRASSIADDSVLRPKTREAHCTNIMRRIRDSGMTIANALTRSYLVHTLVLSLQSGHTQTCSR